MRVFIRRVKEGDWYQDMVPEGGYCRFEAEEDGYIVSIGGRSVFVSESDMMKAKMIDGEVGLDRYGD